jgi:putative nucleotidyltransferase with HDIG domain
MSDAAVRARPQLATAVAFVVVAVGIAAASLTLSASDVKPLAAILVASAVAAELAATYYTDRITVSASFVAAMLAVGFLGPLAALVVPAAAFGGTWLVERYRWRALVINIAGSSTPACLLGIVFAAIDPPQHGLLFVVLLAAAGVATLALNFVIAQPLLALIDGMSVLDRLRSMGALIAPLSINIAVVAVIAEIYAELGLVALVFVLLNGVVFTYMTRLVVTARERTREYANLSWGVLSGLIRTLDERDSRAARHCAAVAAFSRDIAKHCGMSKREQELAHTAGLLHDIGKFALSDRVMERGGQLADADWRGIRRHPDIGAELLRDIGVYGPVAEIVRAHHERPDGRGYPRRLRGEDIPAIARIVAVAEVYDTLTAPDTYRTPMNSFEALNELRRVAGSQLDPVYVEALADLLSGRGTDYRHADEADFDRELDIERRMNEAVAPAP